MIRILKSLHAWSRRKGRKWEDGNKLLVSIENTQPTDGGLEQEFPYMENTAGPGQERGGLGPQEKGQRVLSVLTEVLREDKGSPVMVSAAALVRDWGLMNKPQAEKKETDRYPADWLLQYHQTVDESVARHFPSLPPEDATGLDKHLNAYLGQVLGVVLREIRRLAPVLREAGLLGPVIDRYHSHTFTQLDLMLQWKLTKAQYFSLLQWVLQTYLSQDFSGHPEIQDGVPRVIDPLLLTDWFQRAERNLLTTVQEDISTSLQRILQIEEEDGGMRNSWDEEAFIRLHVDSIQCLNAVIQRSKLISHTLMFKLQRLCCRELKAFIQRYVYVEEKRLQKQLKLEQAGMMHLFRTFNTCRELRSYAQKLAADENNNDDSLSAVSMLKDLENQALQLLLEMPVRLAEASLKKYFMKEDGHIDDLMIKIRTLFTILPTYTNQETQKVVVDEAYHRITYLYLRRLLLSNRRQLERRWGDVGKKVTQDAGNLHCTFSDLHEDVKLRNLFLLKISEILECCDKEALKITCGELLKNYPDEGGEQLRTLLHWRGHLSRRQIREVLDACPDYEALGTQSWCCLCS